jgi:hypothetical protein
MAVLESNLEKRRQEGNLDIITMINIKHKFFSRSRIFDTAGAQHSALFPSLAVK